ncbi:terpenoid cyclases/Protein prenyltransferase [Fistulina hepatica ATCC 64428]|uniref:Protein farnesyltransferase subunit beta n=1 Tax=Fistulina hepatica ATCC 64428 TaxID=1128425 RepID=A0A0D7AF83_9AGAR|nr:terpenoid cyclases/Protein prenyltransferase [Fistulina hepatica ATCC 64428]
MRPTPTDGFPSSTSKLQTETEAILQKYIPNDVESASDESDKSVLNKQLHIQFLARNLIQGFPARYISQDASQPWLLFWTLHALCILQVSLDPGNRQRAVDTVLAWQHPDGGFSGGPGQAAHLLPTYASVCTLAIVGRPGSGGGWDQIDRKKMYDFFMSLKQPDGSFLVSHHGEVDVRGIYCLLVSATLLNILTPELVAGTPAFVASCQTYEGGFASASQPYYDLAGVLLDSPRPPLGEAHGGYTFCAVASWVMLQPFISAAAGPPPAINISLLLRWLVSMQGIEAELGGFKGRTNKLVDGCYSWWIGGCFALLEALGVGGANPVSSEGHTVEHADDEYSWNDVDDSIFNRKALQEYLLYVGQHPAGGLRDKPPKGADAYHTLYDLSGLSAAQHHVFPSPKRRQQVADAWTLSEGEDELRKTVFLDALWWVEEEGGSKFVGGSGNRVNATHPIFNVTITHTEGIMAHFYKQTIPPRILKGAQTTAV